MGWLGIQMKTDKVGSSAMLSFTACSNNSFL